MSKEIDAAVASADALLSEYNTLGQVGLPGAYPARDPAQWLMGVADWMRNRLAGREFLGHVRGSFASKQQPKSQAGGSRGGAPLRLGPLTPAEEARSSAQRAWRELYDNARAWYDPRAGATGGANWSPDDSLFPPGDKRYAWDVQASLVAEGLRDRDSRGVVAVSVEAALRLARIDLVSSAGATAATGASSGKAKATAAKRTRRIDETRVHELVNGAKGNTFKQAGKVHAKEQERPKAYSPEAVRKACDRHETKLAEMGYGAQPRSVRAKYSFHDHDGATT